MAPARQADLLGVRSSARPRRPPALLPRVSPVPAHRPLARPSRRTRPNSANSTEPVRGGESGRVRGHAVGFGGSGRAPRSARPRDVRSGAGAGGGPVLAAEAASVALLGGPSRLGRRHQG